MPARQNFVVRAGTDRTLALVAKDEGGSILDLTGATLDFRMALNVGDTSLVTKDGTITTAASGTYTVALDGDDTTGLFGDYDFQVLATISGEVTICTEGVIRIGATNQ